MSARVRGLAAAAALVLGAVGWYLWRAHGADDPNAALSLFGNVDVYVPEGIAADVTGLTVFGNRREWGRDATQPDAPILRVRVASLFGTVDVWPVPSDLRGGYGDIIRAVRAAQRELPG